MKLLNFPAVTLLCFSLFGCNALEQFATRSNTDASQIQTSTTAAPPSTEKNTQEAGKKLTTLPETAKPVESAPAAKQTENTSIAKAAASVPAPPAPAVTVAAKPAQDDNKTTEKVPPFPVDIWERLRQGYQLRDYEHKRVKTELGWYVKHPEYIERVTERAEPFLHWILEEVEKRNIPNEIALLPIVESAFQPFAYSHGRASGIWQFIPGTGRRFGLKQNWWYDGRRDVIASTRAALDYLSYLHKEFNGDWLLALAAYNSGEGTVNRAIRKNRRLGKAIDFWHLDLPPETRSYVPKLLAISALFDKPEQHNITLKFVSNTPQIATVDIGSQIDLAMAAELAKISLEDIYRLNPGYNRWATDPNGPHQLVVPLEREELFKQNIAELPDDKRIKWKRHKIGDGEAISVIARRYHTTVELLRKVNGMRDNRIRAGRYLIIPVATRSLQQYSLSLQQRRKALLAQNRDGRKVIHLVQNGDTLWDLSVKYRVNVNQLASWNGMAPADTLKAGQKLVIWLKNSDRTKPVLTRVNFRLPAATVRPIHYIVKPGDSLARISARFNVSVQQLRTWNNLQGKKYLRPGQSLKLYVDVTGQT